MSLLVDSLPVDELLRIFDFILAFGVHLIPLLVAARYLLLRDTIFDVTKEYERKAMVKERRNPSRGSVACS